MHYYKLSSVVLVTLFYLTYHLPEATSLTCYSSEDSQNPEVNCKDDNVDTCYTKIDNNKIVRGCTTTDVKCEEPSCIKCKEEKCNSNIICKTCNSTDADCGQTDATNDKFNVICNKNSMYCLTKVQANKTISRGCANEEEKIECDGQKQTCTTCKDDKCNTGVFPEKRLQCYQCNNTECNTIDTLTPKPCFYYAENDSCYTYGFNDTSMTRGCFSDIGGKCNETNTELQCGSCTENGCNKNPYSRKQSLTCLQCSDNNACMSEQDSKMAKECTKEILYNQEEFCYTQVKNNNILRGCYNERTEDLGNCTEPASKCNKCNSNGCNNVEVKFTCLRCRSDVQPECRSETDKLSGQQCSNGTGASSYGCFHGVWNDVVIRGCMIDADIRMQYQCNNEQVKLCEQCDSLDCNAKPTKDDAPGLHINVFFLSFILLIGCLLV